MSIEIKGLDNLIKDLKKISDNAEKLSQKDSVNLRELFNDQFISKNSSFTSLGDLLDKSPFVVKSEEDFLAIPDDEWEKFITENTNFSSWEKMQDAAHSEWLDKQLFS